MGVDRREEEQRPSQEEEAKQKQEEEPPTSPKRRCLGRGGEATIKVARAPTLVNIQEKEKKKEGGDKEKVNKNQGKRKILVKGINDMNVEELRSEMRRRKTKGYSGMKLQELCLKLKQEVNSQRVILVGGRQAVGVSYVGKAGVKGGGGEVGDEVDKPLRVKGGGGEVGDVAVAIDRGDKIVTQLVGSNGGGGGVRDVAVEVGEGGTVMAVDTTKGRIYTREDGQVAVEVNGGVAVETVEVGVAVEGNGGVAVETVKVGVAVEVNGGVAVETVEVAVEVNGVVAVETVEVGGAVEVREAKMEDSVESMTTVKEKDAVDVTVRNNIKQGETHTWGRDMEGVRGYALVPRMEGHGERGAVGAKDGNGDKGNTALDAPSGEG